MDSWNELTPVADKVRETVAAKNRFQGRWLKDGTAGSTTHRWTCARTDPIGGFVQIQTSAAGDMDAVNWSSPAVSLSVKDTAKANIPAVRVLPSIA